MDVPLRLKLLSPRATPPRYHSEHAAGMDLSACLPEGEMVTIRPGQIARIPLGFAIAIPPGFEGQVRPRSGLATKSGVTIPNAPGTIDSDYRGECIVALINLGPEPHAVRHGDRVAQLVIARCEHATVEVVADLDDTVRGAGGFGSTGR